MPLRTRFEISSNDAHCILMKAVLLLCLTLFCLSGCATKKKNEEFVRTITFSSLESFKYEGAVFEGMEFLDSEVELLKQHSEAILVEELQARGFDVSHDGMQDFAVIAVWRKALGSRRNPLDILEGPSDLGKDSKRPSHEVSTGIGLTIEVFESSTGYRFWQKRVPDAFSEYDVTEYKVEDTLTRGIKNFPERVLKDPSLPDIQ